MNGIQGFIESWDSTKPQAMALDTETTGVLWRDKAFCLTAAWDDASFFIDFEELRADSQKHDRVRSILKSVRYQIYHNAKFDIQKLIAAGLIDREDLAPIRIHDTQTMAHLLNEHRSKRLKDLAREVLHEDTDEDEVLRVVRRELKLKVEDGYLPLYRQRPEVLIPYALKDAEFTFRLWKRFDAAIKKRGSLQDKYEQERKLLLVIVDIEAAGMAVNLPYVEEQIKVYGAKIQRAKKKIQEVTGRKVFSDKDLIPREGETKKAAKERADQETFNPNSPIQVQSMFSDFGIALDGTAKSVLENVDHPLATELLNLRECMKIRQTYLIPLLDEASDGVLHPSFRSTGTRTGRFSSGNGD